MKRFLSFVMAFMLLFSVTLASAEGTGISLEANVHTYEGNFNASAIAGIDENGGALLSFTAPDGTSMTLYYSYDFGLVLRDDQTGEWTQLTFQGIPLNLPMLQEMLLGSIDVEALMTAASILPALTQEFAASLVTLPSVQALITKIQTGIATRNINLTEKDFNDVLDEVVIAALNFVFGEENVTANVGSSSLVQVQFGNPELLNQLGLTEMLNQYISIPEPAQFRFNIPHLPAFELDIQGGTITGTISFTCAAHFSLHAYYHIDYSKRSCLIDGYAVMPQGNIVSFNVSINQSGAIVSISGPDADVNITVNSAGFTLDVTNPKTDENILSLNYVYKVDGFVLAYNTPNDFAVIRVTDSINQFEIAIYEDKYAVTLNIDRDRYTYNSNFYGSVIEHYDPNAIEDEAVLSLLPELSWNTSGGEELVTLSGTYNQYDGYLSAIAESKTDRYEILVQSKYENFVLNASHTYKGYRTDVETLSINVFKDNGAFHFNVNTLDRYGDYTIAEGSLDLSELTFAYETNDNKVKLTVMAISENCLLFQYSEQDLWYGREYKYTAIVDITKGRRIELYTPQGKYTLEFNYEILADGTFQYYALFDNGTTAYKVTARQLGDTWIITDGNWNATFTTIDETTTYIRVEPDAQTAIDLVLDLAAELPEIEAPEITSSFEIMNILNMFMGM